MNNKYVAIIGASSSSERYSYMAMTLLTRSGYSCLLVNPKDKEIQGLKVYPALGYIEEDIDTVTIYISPKNQAGLYEQIVNKGCRRIIFNPGTENSKLELSLSKSGFEVIRACTLVMINTGTF